MKPRPASERFMNLHCSHVIALAITSFLLGCASAPPVIDATHPASADAPESSSRRIPNSLSPDAATRRTNALLAERERQAKADETAPAADQSIPNSNTPSPASAPMVGEDAKPMSHHD